MPFFSQVPVRVKAILLKVALFAAMAPRNACMRYLRAVFNFGIKRGYLAENPVSRLDFAQLNAKTANLDLVISVDTAVAHLAGADRFARMETNLGGS